MIKVYLDWSVMVSLKNGSLKELGEILSDKERFITPFSTAHIGDLFSSFDGSEVQQKFIDLDLEFISKFTEERCLFTQGDCVVIDYYPPSELFEQRIDSGHLLNNLSTKGFSSLFEGLGIPDELLNSYSNLLKAIPLDSILRDTLSDPEKAAETEKLFPGLKENPTFEGVLKSMSKMMQGLNENESYKDLRKTVQSGLNIERDRIYDSKNPFELIEKEYQKAGVKRPDNLKNSKHAPAWYNAICDEYIQLDMHGYQEDKVNTQKGRKETFKNTTEDAFHCAFASACNFYVTSDNRAYKKAKKIYEKLGLQTAILKPDEFVEYFKNYLDIKEDSINFRLISAVIKDFNYYEENMTDSKLRIYLIPYFLFDFFNKIMVIIANDAKIESVILSRNNPTHNFVLPIEVRKLITRLNKIFGLDDQNFGDLETAELDDEGLQERVWSREDLKWTLRRVNGHFQLYFNFSEEEISTE